MTRATEIAITTVTGVEIVVTIQTVGIMSVAAVMIAYTAAEVAAMTVEIGDGSGCSQSPIRRTLWVWVIYW